MVVKASLLKKRVLKWRKDFIIMKATPWPDQSMAAVSDLVWTILPKNYLAI